MTQLYTKFKEWYTTEITVWKGNHYLLIAGAILSIFKRMVF